MARRSRARVATRLTRWPGGTDDADELDGLDELLGGFLTRGKKLAVETPRTLAVIVGDEHSWLLTLSDQAPVTVRTPPGRAVAADHVITGTAVGPYTAAVEPR